MSSQLSETTSAGTADPSAPESAGPGRSRRWRGAATRAQGIPESGILIAAVLVFVGWSVTTDLFLTSDNLLSVAQQIALLGIVAVGMTFLMVAGELDLSVGSAYGFLGILLATLLGDHGLPVVAAVAATVAAGASIGAINGLVTVGIGIPSFIVTLGMLSVLRGLALVMAAGLPISTGDHPAFKSIASGDVVGVPAQVLWLVAIVAVGAWVLAKTKFGYDVYATGGNVVAARNAGIRVHRTKVASFVLVGVLTAIAACLLVGWLGSAAPSTGVAFELSVIAAVVIGGTGLSGGVGSVVGTFLGAAVIGMISNGLVLRGVDEYWQQVVTGLIILVAVAAQTLLQRRALR